MAATTQRGADLGREPTEEYEFVAPIRRGSAVTGRGSHATVFVVRRLRDQRLIVEKRMPYAGGRLMHVNEIRIHSTLRHYTILEYMDGFIREPPSPDAGQLRTTPTGRAAAGTQMRNGRPAASLFTEFCSRGSLWDLVNRMRGERMAAGVVAGAAPEAGSLTTATAAIAGAAPRLPEAFIWHVFVSLARALVYLATGHQRAESAFRVNNWEPILHRDVQPKNVFLRAPDAAATAAHPRPVPPRRRNPGPGRRGRAGAGARQTRAATAAATATAAAVVYPDILLGGFGSAVEATDHRRSPARQQQRQQQQQNDIIGTPNHWLSPEQDEHDSEGRSDVYSVGAVVEFLCTATVPSERTTESISGYSPQLVDAVRAARNPVVSERPTPRELFRRLRQLREQAGAAPEPLPAWAVAESDPTTWPDPDGAGRREYERRAGSEVDEDGPQTGDIDDGAGTGDSGSQNTELHADDTGGGNGMQQNLGLGGSGDQAKGPEPGNRGDDHSSHNVGRGTVEQAAGLEQGLRNGNGQGDGGVGHGNPLQRRRPENGSNNQGQTNRGGRDGNQTQEPAQGGGGATGENTHPGRKRRRDDEHDGDEERRRKCRKCGAGPINVEIYFDDCFVKELIVRNNKFRLATEDGLGLAAAN